MTLTRLFRAYVRPEPDQHYPVEFDELPLWDAVKGKLAGMRVIVSIEKEADAKTRLQEQGFHAMIRPWAKECGHQIEALKRDILAETFGVLEERTRSGDRILVKPSTAKLSKEDYSLLIENAMVLAVEWDGYVCIAPDEYRLLHPEKYPPRNAHERKAMEQVRAQRQARTVAA